MGLLPENKVIITVAPTGGVAGTRATNPNVPEQPDEIAQSAYECWNEGAAIVHIHGRDKDGIPTGDVKVYSEIHQRIRAKNCPIILQDTTGTGAQVKVEDRVACLYADPQPEMASLDMGTMVRNRGPHAGTFTIRWGKTLEEWAQKMKEAGVKASMEVFSDSNLREVANLINKGIVDPPYYTEFVLGHPYHGGIDATPKHLMWLVDDLPAADKTVWGVLAVGKAQLPLTTMGMILGGCIRVGFEDNLYYRRGELATSNAQLVARAVAMAREMGKEPATPEEARALLGIKPLGTGRPEQTLKTGAN